MEGMRQLAIRCAGGAITLLVTVYAWAGGPGTTGAQVLRLAVGGRPVAMGEAFAALSDITGAFSNPASLGPVSVPTIAASYNKWYEDVGYGYLGYAQPVGGAVFAGGVSYLMMDVIPKTTDSPTPVGEFTPTSILVNLTFARVVNSRITAGGNLKILHQTLDTESGLGFALDGGGTYRFTETLSAGLALQNVGPGFKYGDGEADPLPMNIKAGMAYRVGDATVALDLNQSSDLPLGVNIGGEYVIKRMLALRAGYRMSTGGEDSGGVSAVCAGIGLMAGRFCLDYAFQSGSTLGATHWVTLALAMGGGR
jgi:hypothetical protein